MSFTAKLLTWYDENKRDLPWRNTKDPYLIWLSEIIMQQTRVDQGLPYYNRFAGVYPTVNDLAGADEQEILKLWQGLGYYSRARNMHLAARYIAGELGGVLPGTYEGIRALKGVGDYTAAAIGSISFGLAVPVVDGNVLRFFTRHFGIREPISTAVAKKAVFSKALSLIDPADPGTFNQALMEFGARYCKPSGPDCEHCIFKTTCIAFREGIVELLPAKVKPTAPRTRYFHYLVMLSDDGMALAMQKREGNDIWKGLYDFPLIETPRPVSLKALLSRPEWEAATACHPEQEVVKSIKFRHVLTHQVILAVFYRLVVKRTSVNHSRWIEMDALPTLPIPRLIDRYLQSQKDLQKKL